MLSVTFYIVKLNVAMLSVVILIVFGSLEYLSAVRLVYAQASNGQMTLSIRTFSIMTFSMTINKT